MLFPESLVPIYITGYNHLRELHISLIAFRQVSVPDHLRLFICIRFSFLCTGSVILNKSVILRCLDRLTTSLTNSIKNLSHFVEYYLGILDIIPHNHKFTVFVFCFFPPWGIPTHTNVLLSFRSKDSISEANWHL